MHKVKSKSDLNEFLNYESRKYGRKSKKIPIFCIKESDYLWKYNVLMRRTEYYTNTKKKIRSVIYKVLLHRYSNKHQIHIPINTFDKGLKLMHLGPVLVNGRVIAGKDISLHINTSIVAGGINNEAPKLNDGVVVGVGAVILGGISLAKNIAVGANAVVNRSFIEENIAIAGVPAKKISNNGRLEWNR
ncbi:serine O-acetyltransferase [Clostridium intestinale]|uniref:Serine O-acetyltransferase n=1 Tax=Clostridium intestinale URNW TaxID=1294142 RepID=U2N9H7_9CLOT|nr:serine O-acetyltransferase [Clostridium intestinale]ERK32157.1 Serine O-acetyltransferase [Clostridium intestinale URNW]